MPCVRQPTHDLLPHRTSELTLETVGFSFEDRRAPSRREHLECPQHPSASKPRLSPRSRLARSISNTPEASSPSYAFGDASADLACVISMKSSVDCDDGGAVKASSHRCSRAAASARSSRDRIWRRLLPAPNWLGHPLLELAPVEWTKTRDVDDVRALVDANASPPDARRARLTAMRAARKIRDGSPKGKVGRPATRLERRGERRVEGKCTLPLGRTRG
jgi:hypothetical protein